MLGDPRSHGLWEHSAPPPPETTTVDGGLTADVVVIGGGYTGLSTAFHLARAGTDTLVIEGKEIGFGGAGRNVGLINAGMWVMPDDIATTLGESYGERLIDLLGNGPREVMAIIDAHGIACELERQGTLHCAVGAKGLRELEQRAEQWQRRGAPVDLLDMHATGKLVGSKAYAGALLDRRAGTLQPLAYARGLARTAISAGARIFTDSPVLSMQHDGKQWLVETSRGSVRSDWVIVATDAYSTDALSSVREEQTYLPYFNMATRPLSDNLARSILPDRQGAWDTKDILSSFRMDKQNRLVFGSVGALRNTGASVHRAWARRELVRLFPQVGAVEFEYEWYGSIGMTDDALPRFHSYGPNAIGFSGYNGRGIAPGTVFGRLLADYVNGRIAESDLPLPVTPLAKPPFRAVREAYYELGAQIAHLPRAVGL